MSLCIAKAPCQRPFLWFSRWKNTMMYIEVWGWMNPTLRTPGSNECKEKMKIDPQRLRNAPSWRCSRSLECEMFWTSDWTIRSDRTTTQIKQDLKLKAVLADHAARDKPWLGVESAASQKPYVWAVYWFTLSRPAPWEKIQCQTEASCSKPMHSPVNICSIIRVSGFPQGWHAATDQAFGLFPLK